MCVFMFMVCPASQWLSKPLPRGTGAFSLILPAFHKRIQGPEDVETLIYAIATKCPYPLVFILYMFVQMELFIYLLGYTLF